MRIATLTLLHSEQPHSIEFGCSKCNRFKARQKNQLTVNGYIFRESYSVIFIFASFLNVGQLLTLLHSEWPKLHCCCFGFNGPLRQYFSIMDRLPERKKEKRKDR